MTPPKNDAKYHWTDHVVQKMMYYGLSADRVKRVMRNPHRSEKGIAPDTIAVMSPNGRETTNQYGKKQPWKDEIWVMYAVKAQSPKLKTENWKLKTDFSPRRKIIITAWRYPGVSKVREAIPIPNDILEELRSIKY